MDSNGVCRVPANAAGIPATGTNPERRTVTRFSGNGALRKYF